MTSNDNEKNYEKYAHNINTSPYEESKYGTRVKDFSKTPVLKFFVDIFDKPAFYIHQKINAIRGQRPVYYHQVYKRVPTVNECYLDDFVCIKEANLQFERDKNVDKKILEIIKNRFNHCLAFHTFDEAILCEDLHEIYKQETINFETKYAELGMKPRAQDAYMKQVHRMILERRSKENK